MDKYDNANEKQKAIILKKIFGKEVTREENQAAIDYVYGLLEADILNEYLVDGAILTCEKAMGAIRCIDGHCFYAYRGERSQLSVVQKARTGKSANANILDAKAKINIKGFGNCTAELTGIEKNRLIGIPEARHNGICKYLMRLNIYWDIMPSTEKPLFIQGYPAINMQARLFCHKGAFIFPITSGQEVVKYGYEDTALFVMDIDDVRFAYENGLTAREMMIFSKIQQYFEDVPKLKESNVIFAFEGLGTKNENEKTNEFHKNGQFNAVFVISKEGKVTYIMRDGSTLPDDKSNAVVKDGIYGAIYVAHRGEYAALQLNVDSKLDVRNDELKRMMDNNLSIRGANANTEGYIPAVRFDGRTHNSASGINLHAAGDLYPNSTWSLGCLTVYYKEYFNFGVEAGFIDKQLNDGKIKNNTYKEVKTLQRNQTGFWGYVVVDRKAMEQDDYSLFFEDDKN